MAAHATPPLLLAAEAGGAESRVSRLMPTLVLGTVIIVGITWWMAAQPPPGPGWGNPNGPQQQWPQGQQPQGYPPPRPVPPNNANTGCNACSNLDCTDCFSGLDCAIDCGDCASGLDCGGCAVGAKAGAPGPVGVAMGTPKTCSLSPWSRLAQSWGLLLPLFVLIGWRRRLVRRPPAIS